MDDIIGIEWLVATIAPATVAPHPNFRPSGIAAYQLMALVADARLADYDAYSDAGMSGWHVEPNRSVSLARRLVGVSTQRAAITPAIRLAHSATEVTPGESASLILFAAVACVECDKLATAVGAVEESIDRLASSPLADSASGRLVSALLHQQLAMRYAELGRRNDATRHAGMAHDICAPGMRFEDPFEVSEGSAYTWRQATELVRESVHTHAAAILASLEGLGGTRWKRVVRSRPCALDDRAYRAVAGGGDAYLKEAFKAGASWPRRSVQWSSSDPVDAPLSRALLYAELSGDFGQVQRRRELLGRSRALRVPQLGSWAGEDALRLLRQADVKEPLEDQMRVVRAAGPVDELASQGGATLRRLRRSGAVTRTDLVVLAASSEMFTADQLGEAIRVALRYRKNPTMRFGSERVADWAVADDAWRTVGRLLPRSQSDDHAARLLLRDVRTIEGWIPSSALEFALGSIEWSSVSERVRAAWVDWVHGPRSEGTDALALAVLDGALGVATHRDDIQRPNGIALAVRLLLERAHGILPEPRELAEAVDATRSAIARIRALARSGSFSMGGYSPADIGVLLVTQCGVDELMEPVLDLLSDAHVASSDKAPALDRLALLRPVLSPGMVESFRGLSVLTSRSRSGSLGTEPQELPIDPPALRFGIAYALVESVQVLNLVTSMAGSHLPLGRYEAVRSLAACVVQYRGREWPVALLLVLSRDRDPIVRAEAARFLPAALDSGSMHDVVLDRVREFVEEDSVIVPLSALRGLSERENTPDEVVRSIRSAALRHSVPAVRDLAAKVLK